MTKPSTKSAISSRILFAKIKDWRHIHTRYGQSAHASMSAICIAATVIFWFNQ